jgi:hypothetical protein
MRLVGPCNNVTSGCRFPCEIKSKARSDDRNKMCTDDVHLFGRPTSAAEPRRPTRRRSRWKTAVPQRLRTEDSNHSTRSPCAFHCGPAREDINPHVSSETTGRARSFLSSATDLPDLSRLNPDFQSESPVARRVLAVGGRRNPAPPSELNPLQGVPNRPHPLLEGGRSATNCPVAIERATFHKVSQLQQSITDGLKRMLGLVEKSSA